MQWERLLGAGPQLSRTVHSRRGADAGTHLLGPGTGHECAGDGDGDRHAHEQRGHFLEPRGQGGQSQQALLAAGKTALGAVSGSTVISIETEDNGAAWEAQVVTSDGVEHKVVTSRDGTKVVRGPRKDDDDAQDRAKHRRRVKAAKVDYREAARLISGAVPGGRITELGLDGHRGKTVWEADVMDGSNTKHEVMIDAATGKLLQNRPD